MAEIREAHARYSAKQLENDKTTRVLEAGFGKEFTKRYMRTGTQLCAVSCPAVVPETGHRVVRQLTTGAPLLAPSLNTKFIWNAVVFDEEDALAHT
jgi:hypothetical protein